MVKQEVLKVVLVWRGVGEGQRSKIMEGFQCTDQNFTFPF